MQSDEGFGDDGFLSLYLEEEVYQKEKEKGDF